VLIEAVLPDTTAAEANLSPGDILLAVDGKAISSVVVPNPMIAAMAVGQQFTVTLQRAGQRTSLAPLFSAFTDF
jgi:S1-C subfamily serine protease